MTNVIKKAATAIGLIAVAAMLAELTVKAGCLLFLAVFAPETLATL